MLLATAPPAGASVEAVLIPMFHRQGSRKHLTLCVSSQVGCAMNCQFCYTGRMGLSGNLSTAQIVEQVRQAQGMQSACQKEWKQKPHHNQLISIGLICGVIHLSSVWQCWWSITAGLTAATAVASVVAGSCSCHSMCLLPVLSCRCSWPIGC